MKIKENADPAGSMEYRHDTLDNPLRGPRGSLGTRKIGRKSDKSGRAVILAPDQNGAYRQIIVESLLEAKFCWVALADRRIIHVLEQPPAFTYRDAYGKKRKHKPDFLLTLADKTKVCVDIRPAARADKVREIAAAAARQVNGYADYFTIVTENELPAWKVQNAQLILSCRRDEDRSADEAIREIVAEISAPALISRICEATGLGGTAFRALVRLIDEGQLKATPHTRIEWNTRVFRTASKKEVA